MTIHTEASDLGLHCLHMSHKKDARLILFNSCTIITLKRTMGFSIKFEIQLKSK